jgi:protein involved in polysaccharide export with SLBB domain
MKYLALLPLIALLMACSASESLMLPSTMNDPGIAREYRLMPGDVVELQVTQRDDISGVYTLDPSGSLL